MKTPWIALSCLLVTACSPQATDNAANPAAYAVKLAVTPAEGRGVQRMDLPAVAIVALRSPDRSDVRIFDGDGKPLSIAATAPAAGSATIESIRLEAFPIIGTDGALAADGASLRIEQRDGDRVVSVVQAAGSEGRPETLGALLDTRAIMARARSLRLDAVLPPQQPVTFSIETSSDLTSWTPIAGKTLYRRTGAQADTLGPEAIPLDDAELKGRYLRISWSSPQRLLAAVELRGATIEVARKLDLADRRAIPTTPPQRIDAHDVRFSLPQATALSGLVVEPAGAEQLVPMTLFGRNAADQAWAPLGSGTLRGGAAAVLDLSGGVYRDYRIEADRRTTGFAAPPRLRLLFDPAPLIVLFDGRPPYTLAAGAKDAENRYLMAGELLPGYRPGAEDRLPVASIEPTPAAQVALVTEDARAISPRKALLWGLLLLGLAALAAMVWRLWKPRVGSGA